MVQWGKIVELNRKFQNSRFYTPFSELQESLKCSRATLFRLLTILKNEFHAPLERSQKYHGYRYDTAGGKYEFPGLWFKPNELESLVCLEHALKGLQQGFLQGTLQPFESKFEPLLKAQGVKLKTWQERFKIIPIGSRKIKPGIFETASDALLHEKRLSITYRRLGDADPTTRIVSPQTILRYRDNWYLDAWCHKAKDLRTFSLNRFEDAKIIGQKAKLVRRKELDEYYTCTYGIFSGPCIGVATIRFTGTAAKEVIQEEWHPQQQGIPQSDGSYVLKIPYGHSLELAMDILRWGADAEVIDPPNLRKDIALRLKQASDKYLSS